MSDTANMTDSMLPQVRVKCGCEDGVITLAFDEERECPGCNGKGYQLRELVGRDALLYSLGKVRSEITDEPSGIGDGMRNLVLYAALAALRAFDEENKPMMLDGEGNRSIFDDVDL